MWAREGRKMGMGQKCGWNVGGALPFRLHLHLLLLLLLPGLACALLDVCFVENTKLSVAQEEKNLIHLRENHGSVTVLSKGCDLNHTFDLDKKLLEGMIDSKEREWIEMRYYIKPNSLDIYFAGKSIYRVSHPVDGACVSAHKQYFVFKNISFGYDCTGYDKSDNSQRMRRPHLIWIPIGSLVLLVALCCRCIRNRNGEPIVGKWRRRRRNNGQSVVIVPQTGATGTSGVVVSQANLSSSPSAPNLDPSYLPCPSATNLVSPPYLPPSATNPVPPPYLPPSATNPVPPPYLPPSATNLVPPPYLPPSATNPVPPPYLPPSATNPVSPPYLPPSATNPVPPPYLPPSAINLVPPPYQPPSATIPTPLQSNPTPPSTTDSKPKDLKPTLFSKFRNQFGFTRLQEDRPT